jgi:GNAT superfamily N-acetyltransferase
MIPAVRMALDVDIRPLSEKDYPALVAELGRGHAKYFRKQLPLQNAGKGIILVAFRKSRPVGAVLVLWAEPAEERKLRLRLPGVPLLYHVFVKESLRRRGIGTQLLAAVHEELRAHGHRKVTLGVDAVNKDAKRLYERLGYDDWEDESWGAKHKRRYAGSPEEPSAGYAAMVLDLERNDRTGFLGAAIARPESLPNGGSDRPPALSKRILRSVLTEVLGESRLVAETSTTPAEPTRPGTGSTTAVTVPSDAQPQHPSPAPHPQRRRWRPPFAPPTISRSSGRRKVRQLRTVAASFLSALHLSSGR